LLNYDKLDVLNLFAHRYKHVMNNLDTYEIRQSLGEYFSVANSTRCIWISYSSLYKI